MIKFENIDYRYNNEENVLQNVSFTLEAGSYHYLTGPSGSGKTSLINLLNLGNFPHKGKITMFGQKIDQQSRAELSNIRKTIGVVFQDFRLIKHLNAFDNVALPLRIQNQQKNVIEKNVNELLQWVGLGGFEHKRPLELSGGQQQRIAIARAVISQPKLLLADEPTGNLDDEIGFRLMHLFEQLNQMGTTIVIATHNPQIIQKFRHPFLQLQNGTVKLNQNTEKIRDIF